jgi:hypothetical protein
MHQPLHEQIAKLESIFDELHDFLSDEDGIRSDMAMKALHGSLRCKALYCDILNEQGGSE